MATNISIPHFEPFDVHGEPSTLSYRWTRWSRAASPPLTAENNYATKSPLVTMRCHTFTSKTVHSPTTICTPRPTPLTTPNGITRSSIDVCLNILTHDFFMFLWCVLLYCSLLIIFFLYCMRLSCIIKRFVFVFVFVIGLISRCYRLLYWNLKVFLRYKLPHHSITFATGTFCQHVAPTAQKWGSHAKLNFATNF